MSQFIVDLPVPSMGATVSELTIVNLAVSVGAQVAKGQKLAELESDKSSFEFESPWRGESARRPRRKGAVMSSGQPDFRLQNGRRESAPPRGGGRRAAADLSASPSRPLRRSRRQATRRRKRSNGRLARSKWPRKPGWIIPRSPISRPPGPAGGSREGRRGQVSRRAEIGGMPGAILECPRNFEALRPRCALSGGRVARPPRIV